MSDAVDKLMYTFVIEDVLKGVFVYVPPGYVACVYDLGRGVLKKVYAPGLHLKIPFWQKAKLFNTQTLEYSIAPDVQLDNPRALGDEPISCISQDNKQVIVEATVLLRLDVHQIPAIWQAIGEDFVEKIVRPTIRSRMRTVASHFTAQQICQTHRHEVEESLKQELEEIFSARGIFVENVLLSDIHTGG